MVKNVTKQNHARKLPELNVRKPDNARKLKLLAIRPKPVVIKLPLHARKPRHPAEAVHAVNNYPCYIKRLLINPEPFFYALFSLYGDAAQAWLLDDISLCWDNVF